MHRPTSPSAGRPRPSVQAIALEAGLVLAVGLTGALLANALSPRGIELTRDYFPAAPPAAVDSPSPAHPAPAPDPNDETTSPLPEPVETASPAPEISPSAEALVGASGFGVVHREEMTALYHDPRQDLELITFVDARDDRHFQEGHIPRAYPLDRFYPDRYLPEVLGPCLASEQVVVYCNGGDCEDSLFAARLLHEAGVPAEHLSVYLGGIQEWKAAGLPLEFGPRLSGDIRSSAATGSPPPP